MRFLIIALLLLVPFAAKAQPYQVVSSCGSVSNPGALGSGMGGYIDTSGNICVSASGSSLNGADASGANVTPSGAPSAETIAALAAQQGVLLDAFKVSGDADDTASMTRAVAAGVPILLGPKTYTINNYSMAGTPANFVLLGVPGKSLIQRTSASGSQFFQISATNVVIDGVTFDMNKASVTANQWGVFLGAGGQNVSVTNSVFKNNSGTLGTCFALVNTSGAQAGGGFRFAGNEVSGCTYNSTMFASVSNGSIESNYVHDNTAFGIWVGAYLTPSSTNYSTEISVANNRVYRSVQGISVGGFSPPFAFGTPSATHVRVENNGLQDNSGYQLVLQGDYLTAIGNHIDQSPTPVSLTGGIDSNSRFNVIEGNTITLSGSSYGIDCGGSVGTLVTNNTISINSGQAIDSGGNQNSTFSGNKLILSGTAIGIINYEVESSGPNAFPTIASGTLIERNTFDMTGSLTRGIEVLDNAGGRSGSTATIVRDNRFNLSGGTGPSQDIIWFGAPASLIISGNYHNGTNIDFVDPNGSNDVAFDYVYAGGTVQGSGSTANIRSIITPNVNSFGNGQSILYVEPLTGGSGYVPATTTLAATGSTGGSGWTGTPMINNGVIIGVRTSTVGAGYTGTLSVTATDTSGGTGATFSVGNVAGIPRDTQIAYQSVATHILQASGGFIGVNDGNIPLILNNNTRISLQANTIGSSWNLAGFTIQAFTTAGLPTCNATASSGQAIATDALTPTYAGTLTGGGAVRTPVICNGTNWITH